MAASSRHESAADTPPLLVEAKLAIPSVRHGVVDRPRVRRALDGERAPSVTKVSAAVAIADVESEISGGRSPGTLLLEEIGYGVLGGVVAGLLIATIITQAGAT